MSRKKSVEKDEYDSENDYIVKKVLRKNPYEVVDCECGKKYTRCNKTKHYKSEIHKTRMMVRKREEDINNAKINKKKQMKRELSGITEEIEYTREKIVEYEMEMDENPKKKREIKIRINNLDKMLMKKCLLIGEIKEI
jgi:hypothetical protein